MRLLTISNGKGIVILFGIMLMIVPSKMKKSFVYFPGHFDFDTFKSSKTFIFEGKMDFFGFKVMAFIQEELSRSISRILFIT